MKVAYAMIFLVLIFCSCSKVTQKRLEGTWILKEIQDISSDVSDTWENLLDTAQVKVMFYEDGTMESYFLKNGSVTDLSTSTYRLSEKEETLEIDDISTIFNSSGHPLEVADLHKKSMTLEGRYYLQFINPSLPADSFTMLRWEFEK